MIWLLLLVSLALPGQKLSDVPLAFTSSLPIRSSRQLQVSRILTSAIGLEWSRNAPPPPHTDTASPVFPERPIRPLPKRGIRSRLSEDEANLIGRPLDPSSSPSVFGSPSTQRDSTIRPNHFGETQIPPAAPNFSAPGAYESEEERDDEAFAGQRSSWSNEALRYPRGSTASSIDGESFENTNNKKKRKIPLHHSSNFPVDPHDSDNGYGSATASWQMDGTPSYPGKMATPNTRARNARTVSRGSKQPLGNSMNAVNHSEGKLLFMSSLLSLADIGADHRIHSF